jgi:transcriptional regulator with XRE-family HTH domain
LFYRDYILFGICEIASVMPKPLAPAVRSQFAKRLKEMRAEAGFPRARYFAKSLGIEENRYTRYERAEVEPSLTLIHQMCEALHVSPNQLLGFAEPGGHAGAGFYEEAPRGYAPSAYYSASPLDLLAWRLASEVARIRGKSHRSGKGVADDPLAAMRETGMLFQRLQRDPMGTVAEIAADEALTNLDPKRRSAVAELIKAFSDAMTDQS